MNHVLVGLFAVLLQQTDTTISVRPDARLELENMQGSIVVKAWDRNQIRIKATHGRRDWIEVSARPSVVTVEARSRTGVARNVNYEINVPTSMSLDLSGTNTSIDLQGVRGEVEAETVNGDVLVSGGSGRIRLESVQGRIVLSNARGRVDVSTVNEGVHLRDVMGDVVVETVNGMIVLERVQATTVEAASVNGTIVYDGTLREDGSYLLSTHNGAIWLVVPERTNATVHVSTFSGRLDASFPVSFRGAGTSRKHFSFVLGSGSGRVDLESFSGDLRLRRPGEQRPGFSTGSKSKLPDN